MRAAHVLILVAACAPRPPAFGPAVAIAPTSERAIDTSPKERRRMLPPEAYLRAYLAWFGGLAPLDVQARAKPRGMFDTWDDYLAALGLPDDRIDLPRAQQSNTLMAATLGRLGEALCARAAEHDLHDRKIAPDARVVFAFAPAADLDAAAFAPRLDVLHRLFLGYPLRLAPPGRAAALFALYTRVVGRHPTAKQPLTADELGWVAVCSALVQHPEAELY